MSKSGYCVSGYCIFRLEHFPVMPSSRSAKKQGYCIFRYAIFSHPSEEIANQVWTVRQTDSICVCAEGHFISLPMENSILLETKAWGSFRTHISVHFLDKYIYCDL
jgi:hypothetical protein